MRRFWIGAGIALSAASTFVAVGARARSTSDVIALPLPVYPPVAKSIWLDQNWSDDKRSFYHYAGQGATTFGIPFEWFIALERPTSSLSSPGLLSAADYLDRMGFIPPDRSANGLPIGFEHGGPMIDPASGTHWSNPLTGADMTTVGLTCAACHTGRLTYKGTALYVDGGGALIDLGALRNALTLSLTMTRRLPSRFDRFALRVLGTGATVAAKRLLSAQLDDVIAKAAVARALQDSVADRSVEEGYGRLDALNRIGNGLFAVAPHIKANYVPTNAPVRYPHIWGASRFAWVEYNASTRQPMIRNGGEALGLGVKVDLTGAPTPTFDSDLALDSIYRIEQTLRGDDGPRSGLHAPRWPEGILPPIDRTKAAKGARLYVELCQGCHLPPVDSPAFDSPALREPNSPHGLILPLIPIREIGTDPAQASDFAARKVIMPPGLGSGSTSFAPALARLVETVVDRWYDRQTPPVDPARRASMNGEVPNMIRTPLAYKARPLDGIWATAPYLHNGSVPTLYDLLLPVARRPTRFTVASREFDPINVGLKTDEMTGGTLIDTSISGNLNIGHEFDDASGRPGVIGRKLSEEEREDLIEYLKTL